MTGWKIYLDFGQSSLEARYPVFQKICLRSNAEGRDDQREGDMPVPRLRHHFLGFGINDFNRFSPLRVIRLRLSGL
jgi:hypothetical protein